MRYPHPENLNKYIAIQYGAMLNHASNIVDEGFYLII